MDSDTDWIVVGRFGRPHGIKGFVTVVSFTDPRDNVMRYTEWHAKIKNQWQPITLIQHEVNQKHILVQVEGYNDRELVAQLTNTDIAVRREQLPALPPGEYYWHELVGMRVINPEGLLYGTVTDILSTGANDVLVVVGERRHLIPYLLGTCILGIDDSERTITADWDMDF